MVTLAASDKDNNNTNQVKQLLSNLVDIGLTTLNSPNTISKIIISSLQYHIIF